MKTRPKSRAKKTSPTSLTLSGASTNTDYAAGDTLQLEDESDDLAGSKKPPYACAGSRSPWSISPKVLRI